MPTPRLCRPHTTGVSPKTPAFFQAGCPACEDKKARGVVTGLEGPLSPTWFAVARVARSKLKRAPAWAWRMAR